MQYIFSYRKTVDFASLMKFSNFSILWYYMKLYRIITALIGFISYLPSLALLLQWFCISPTIFFNVFYTIIGLSYFFVIYFIKKYFIGNLSKWLNCISCKSKKFQKRWSNCKKVTIIWRKLQITVKGIIFR